MRKIKEVLRLKYELGLGQRQIARSCSIGLGTVQRLSCPSRTAGINGRFPRAGMTSRWKPRCLAANPSAAAEPERTMPDFAVLHEQRQKNKHVTLQLLWEEYREANPDGYQYSRFCDLYQRWRGTQDVVLRQEYKAGEKLFVDWAGPTIPIYSRTGGRDRAGASVRRRAGRQFLYLCRSIADEQTINWLTAHMRAFEFFGGLPTPDRPG